MRRKKSGNLSIRLICVTLCIFMLLSVASCSEPQKEEEVTQTYEPSEKIYLISDDTPNCTMTISDEVFEYIKANSGRQYILDLMNDYFNVVINSETDPNVVYIRAVSEKIDAEVRLAEIYDPSNKFSLLVRIAGIGESVLPARPFSEEEEESNSRSLSDYDNTDSPYITESLQFLRKVGDKGAIYSVAAIKNDFREKTLRIYDKPDSIIRKDDIQSLRYGDYYIDVNEEGMSIICGSNETVCSALDYFLTEYIQMGSSSDSNYIIDVPDKGIHAGNYYKTSIAGNSLDDYTIMYYCDKTYYDSRENAKYLRDYFEKYHGVRLLLKDSDSSREIKKKIVIGRSRLNASLNFYSGKPDIMDYRIVSQGDNLFIMGGSDWAIKYAIDYLIDEYFSKEIAIPPGFSKEGSIYGDYLFPLHGDSDLRLMSNNVWNCAYNSSVWLENGLKSFNFDRHSQMAKVYLAYNPDVLCLQEMNSNAVYFKYMLDQINQCDRHYAMVNISYIGSSSPNWTPVIYNTDTLRLLDSGSYIYPYGSDVKSKSFTWGYFEMKKSGYRFIVFSTHLWWKSNSVYPGSSDIRTSQLKELRGRAEWLMEKYGCPCYVMGDFNCRATTAEFKSMLENNYVDCHDIATDYASNSSGRFVCFPTSFSYKVSGGTYLRNSLDHIVATNLTKEKVVVYDNVTPNFYGKLSDHAPVFVDVCTDSE